MNDLNWKDQYKKWKTGLKPFQIQLLDEGANSLSQSWLLNAMWCDWTELKKIKETELPDVKTTSKEWAKDPWE